MAYLGTQLSIKCIQQKIEEYKTWRSITFRQQRRPKPTDVMRTMDGNSLRRLIMEKFLSDIRSKCLFYIGARNLINYIVVDTNKFSIPPGDDNNSS